MKKEDKHPEVKDIFNYIEVNSKYQAQLQSRVHKEVVPQEDNKGTKFGSAASILSARLMDSQRAIRYIATFFDKKLNSLRSQLNALLLSDGYNTISTNINSYDGIMNAVIERVFVIEPKMKAQLNSLLAPAKNGILAEHINALNKFLSPYSLKDEDTVDYATLYKVTHQKIASPPLNWAAYQNIFLGAEENKWSKIRSNLYQIYWLYAPHIEKYHEMVSGANNIKESERTRKQCLAALKPDILHSITFIIKEGKVKGIQIRRKDIKNPNKINCTYNIPDFFLTHFNISLVGHMDIDILQRVINGEEKMPDPKDTFLDTFIGSDAEITLSKGNLFLGVVKHIEDALNKWEGWKDVVTGRENNSFRDQLLKRLYYFYKWYKDNKIKEISGYDFLDVVKELLNIEIKSFIDESRIRIKPKGDDERLKVFTPYGM